MRTALVFLASIQKDCSLILGDGRDDGAYSVSIAANEGLGWGRTRILRIVHEIANHAADESMLARKKNNGYNAKLSGGKCQG